MKFCQDSKTKKLFARVCFNMERNLGGVDAEVAREYVEWLDRKTKFFLQSFERAGYGPQPDDLQRGDVVWAEFGINVGTELSDFSTKGHYAVVWAVDLGNIIVIPLSSRPAPGSTLTFDIGVIPNLVQENTEGHSYLKLDAIRSISKRRIGRMPGKDGGKVVLSPENIEHIKEIIENSFLA